MSLPERSVIFITSASPRCIVWLDGGMKSYPFSSVKKIKIQDTTMRWKCRLANQCEGREPEALMKTVETKERSYFGS